jgi:CheY-like chemotaxis protein
MPKILIVAPEDLAPELGRTRLWKKDVERVFVSSPAIALDLARSFIPSLVVLDGADGAAAVGLVERLRESAGTRRAALLVWCASALPEQEQEALRHAGANLVLNGPVDPSRWDAPLDMLLNVSRRLHARFPVRFTRGDSVAAGDGDEALALDLGLGGMLIETLTPLAQEQQLELRFCLPGQDGEVRVEGSVVRATSGRTEVRCGIRFTTLHGDAAGRIRLFIDTVAPEKSFGRYEVLGGLGEGSMGRVYRAFDPLARRVVAIKTLNPENLAGDARDEPLRRFRREAQAAAKLVHTNIVTIFDVGENYFVMELLDGATLQTLLAHRGRLAPAEAMAILGPVADALDYAHAEGTIHRDVKPANIMVLADGRPKIMDFGVAHLTSAVITARGQSFGSPAYMAPEQVLKSQATPMTDLFSFAVVAYETFTGRRPFDGESVTSMLFHVVNTEPPPPSRWNSELPSLYDGIFRRALAKDPAERFPSARAFVAALGHEVGVALPPLPRRHPRSGTTLFTGETDATLEILEKPESPDGGTE